MSFFLDKVPEMLKDRNDMEFFTRLFALYLDGALSQSEFFDLVQDLVEPNQTEHQ